MQRMLQGFPRLLVTVGSFVLCGSLLAAPLPRAQDSKQSAPDNTRANKDQTSPAADQQKMNSSDRAITQKIRKAIMKDKELSTYAHNVKIITRDGNVTLRGPVRSEHEKDSVEAAATEIAGKDHVTSQIEIAPSK